MLLTATGCSPTQPFYLHEDGDLSHYVATVTELENPDVEQISLEEVTQARPPLTLSEAEFNNFRDVTLEECVSIALQNSKVIRNLGSLTQFTIADGLVGRTAGSMTVYDPAVFESDPQFGVEAALSEFDAQFSTKAFWERTDRPQNAAADLQALFPRLFQRDSGQFNAELTKRTATGTTFAVRNETIYDSNNNPSRVLLSDWTTIMSVQATQPLLRGNGAQVNRAALDPGPDPHGYRGVGIRSRRPQHAAGSRELLLGSAVRLSVPGDGQDRPRQCVDHLATAI